MVNNLNVRENLEFQTSSLYFEIPDEDQKKIRKILRKKKYKKFDSVQNLLAESKSNDIKYSNGIDFWFNGANYTLYTLYREWRVGAGEYARSINKPEDILNHILTS